MSLTNLICFLLISLFVTLARLGCNGQSACMDRATFEYTCQQTNGGQVSGDQCLFLGDRNQATWDVSWKKCTDRGATMGQVQTSKDYQAVLNLYNLYKNQYGVTAIFLAMRQQNDEEPDQNRQPTTYYWYNSQTGSTSPSLTWATTWARTHVNDDTAVIGDCATIYNGYLADASCDLTRHVLCQYSNQNQSFAQLPSGACISEAPVMQEAGVTDQQCADTCASMIWCRSFNFYNAGNRRCEYFSWDAINDRPNMRAAIDCVVYSNSD